MGGHPNVRKLELIVARRADALLTTEVGLSRGQLLVLECLATEQHARTSQSQLAEHLGLTRAAVSCHGGVLHIVLGPAAPGALFGAALIALGALALNAVGDLRLRRPLE